MISSYILVIAKYLSRGAQGYLVVGVHVENSDCCPARGTLADKVDSLPLKMVVPFLSPRMKQFCNVVRLRIDAG